MEFIDKEIYSYVLFEYDRPIPIRFIKRILNKLPNNTTHLKVILESDGYDTLSVEGMFIERREKTEEEIELEKQKHEDILKAQYLRAKDIVENFEKNN